MSIHTIAAYLGVLLAASSLSTASFASSESALYAFGFHIIGKVPNIPILSLERIGWLYTAHTGLAPEYRDSITNGEYQQKAGRQMPQFCQLNRLRFSVCEYMRTNDPVFLEEYVAQSKAGVVALLGKEQFLMVGGALASDFDQPHDPARPVVHTRYDGTRGGIVLGVDCWFSHDKKAPHACINIDNIKALNQASLPIANTELARRFRQEFSRSNLALLVKVKVRQPFSVAKTYARKMGAEFFTAWVVATNVYLVDQEGNIYYDIPVQSTPSEMDKIDAYRLETPAKKHGKSALPPTAASAVVRGSPKAGEKEKSLFDFDIQPSPRPGR